MEEENLATGYCDINKEKDNWPIFRARKDYYYYYYYYYYQFLTTFWTGNKDRNL
jgi:hypothetical protein